MEKIQKTNNIIGESTEFLNTHTIATAESCSRQLQEKMKTKTRNVQSQYKCNLRQNNFSVIHT